MHVILFPVAAYLILYAPGHHLLGRQAPAAGSRLFREVLLSVSCASWIGFVLAELGVYSLTTLLGALALLAGAARVHRWHAPAVRYRAVDAGGAAVAIATLLWLSPPFDTRLAGADSSGYLASGVHLAHHGSLIIHDPTLPLLSPDLKRTLFPSVAPDRGSPPYLRLAGSMVLRSLDSDEVLPAFHHLITVWMAVLDGLGIPPQWTVTLFGALSVWAMVEFASAVGGLRVALPFVPLLLLLAPQYWYSRFAMPEVPAQFFLWSGLSCTALSWRRMQRRDAVLAGIAFGLAGLMRAENVAFLWLSLLLALLAADRQSRGQLRWILGCASLIWFHALVHLAVFRTHYWGILHSVLADNLSLLRQSPWVLLALAITGAGWTVWNYLRPRNASSSILLLLAAFAAALWIDAGRGWHSSNLLRYYCGTFLLVGGAAGMLLVARDAWKANRLAIDLLAVLLAVVVAQVAIEPHVTPVPIWVVRRAVTVLLPALCFGVAFAVAWLRQRTHWIAAVGCLAIALAGETPALLQMRDTPYYREVTRHIRTLALLLPPGSRLLCDSQIAGYGIAQTLWAEYGLPAYLIPAGDLVRLRELVHTFGTAPVIWLSSGNTPPPQGSGVVSHPLALYEFLLTVPDLDIGSVPGATVNWDFSVALYALHSN